MFFTDENLKSVPIHFSVTTNCELVTEVYSIFGFTFVTFGDILFYFTFAENAQMPFRVLYGWFTQSKFI